MEPMTNPMSSLGSCIQWSLGVLHACDLELCYEKWAMSASNGMGDVGFSSQGRPGCFLFGWLIG